MTVSQRLWFCTVLVVVLGCGNVETFAETADPSEETSDGDETDGLLSDGPQDESETEDNAAAPSDDACNVYKQDCPDTQKCTPYSGDGDTTWNAVRCTAKAGEPKGLGESCTAPDGPVAGTDDCDAGLICWNVPPGETEGVCTALCAGSSAAGFCPDDSVCSVYNDGALPICLPTCDPLGLGCEAGEVCIPQGGGAGRFVCAVDAAPNGGSYGDACLAFNKCDPGLFCAPASAVPGCTEALGCCSQYCDLSAPEPDSACDGAAQGQSCVPFSENGAAPGFESIGACAIP